VPDQRQPIMGKDIRRIGSGVMRLGAAPVGPKVRHDQPEIAASYFPGMAELDPVCIRIGE
jgi:hypothetical protein